MARPVLGMGCSRLGSLLARSGRAEAEEAVRAALAAGITVFDTSNIYGQGSSELILGRLLPTEGVEICTKAGFVPPAPLWILRLVKRALRVAMPRRGRLGRGVAERRSRSFPQRFEASYLRRCLDASLRRLGRPRVAMFLLHNPPPAVHADPALWRWVREELSRGRIGAFGISCAGEAEDRAWLAHPEVTLAQLPARALLARPGPFMADPRARRLRILARELVGPGEHTPDAIGRRLREVAAVEGVSVALLGMSSSHHVREAASLFRDALRAMDDAEAVVPVAG
jgi:aryl-alcohol dehydrogenase-like predicted oxidoreductase